MSGTHEHSQQATACVLEGVSSNCESLEYSATSCPNQTVVDSGAESNSSPNSTDSSCRSAIQSHDPNRSPLERSDDLSLPLPIRRERLRPQTNIIGGPRYLLPRLKEAEGDSAPNFGSYSFREAHSMIRGAASGIDFFRSGSENREGSDCGHHHDEDEGAPSDMNESSRRSSGSSSNKQPVTSATSRFLKMDSMGSTSSTVGRLLHGLVFSRERLLRILRPIPVEVLMGGPDDVPSLYDPLSLLKLSITEACKTLSMVHLEEYCRLFLMEKGPVFIKSLFSTIAIRVVLSKNREGTDGESPSSEKLYIVGLCVGSVGGQPYLLDGHWRGSRSLIGLTEEVTRMGMVLRIFAVSPHNIAVRVPLHGVSNREVTVDEIETASNHIWTAQAETVMSLSKSGGGDDGMIANEDAPTTAAELENEDGDGQIERILPEERGEGIKTETEGATQTVRPIQHRCPFSVSDLERRYMVTQRLLAVSTGFEEINEIMPLLRRGGAVPPLSEIGGGESAELNRLRAWVSGRLQAVQESLTGGEPLKRFDLLLRPPSTALSHINHE